MTGKINVTVLVRDHFATFAGEGRLARWRALSPLVIPAASAAALMAAGARLPEGARLPVITFLGVTALGVSSLLRLALRAAPRSGAGASRALCANVLFAALLAVVDIVLLVTYSPDVGRPGLRSSLLFGVYFLTALHVSTLLTILGRAAALARE